MNPPSSASQDRLPPRQQLVGTHKWPLVGERVPLESDAPWSLEICGLVKHAAHYSLDELQKLPSVDRTLDIHCVTRWSKYDVTFSGPRLIDVLQSSVVLPDVRFLSFVARTERSHSTSLSWKDVQQLDPIIALRVDGKPLPTQHGGPVRLITPGRYFYKSVKWLTRVEALATDRLGYWEAEAGYHNHADPWLEERYVASELTKQQAARLIETRDFRGQSLLGFEGRDRDWQGLNAEGAELRDARFSGSNLSAANFADSNLSNADFRNCDLAGANFRGADVEGADFTACDLRNVDFSGASLFGATFVATSEATDTIRTTLFSDARQLSQEQLNMLTEEQQQGVATLFGQL